MAASCSFLPRDQCCWSPHDWLLWTSRSSEAYGSPKCSLEVGKDLVQNFPCSTPGIHRWVARKHKLSTLLLKICELVAFVSCEEVKSKKAMNIPCFRSALTVCCRKEGVYLDGCCYRLALISAFIFKKKTPTSKKYTHFLGLDGKKRPLDGQFFQKGTIRIRSKDAHF